MINTGRHEEAGARGDVRRKGSLGARDKGVLSQRDYVPTPYCDSSWEIVGERVKERDFVPIRLEVYRSELASPDPMFEDFGGGIGETAVETWHSKDGRSPLRKKDEAGEESQRRKIDEKELEAKLAEGIEIGRKTGYEEGYQRAREEAQKAREADRVRLEQLGASVSSQASKLFAGIEKEAVKLALEVSRKILVTTAEIRPDYIVDVIRQAMSVLGAAKPIRIRVSEDDYEFLSVVGLPPELSKEELGVEYVPDESVKSGCVVETDFGQVNLELEKMWEQVKEGLYEIYK